MIDWQRVDALKEEVGEEDFEEIVDLFLEEVGELIDQLRDVSDLNTLGESLHFLKGSSLNLGFVQVAELCSAGEAASNAGQPETIDLKEVLDAFATSKETFLKTLSETKAA